MHFFATPAVATSHGSASALSSHRFFANYGGEGFLVQPHVEATGYHQDADTVDFRSIILTMKGTSLHLVVVYFDSSIGLDAGPNVDKAKEALKIIAAIKLPWLIVGDFNVPPDECVASAFYSYLGGTLLAPKVVLDYGICSPELAEYIDLQPFYDHPCTPHVVAVDFSICSG